MNFQLTVMVTFLIINIMTLNVQPNAHMTDVSEVIAKITIIVLLVNGFGIAMVFCQAVITQCVNISKIVKMKGID